MARISNKQKLFNGRDHSWMQFNRRVLEEAEDPSNPLLERVKFLAITGNNLDEYVEVRQAGLMQRIEDGYREPGYDGLCDLRVASDVHHQHARHFLDEKNRCGLDDQIRRGICPPIRPWRAMKADLKVSKRYPVAVV